MPVQKYAQMLLHMLQLPCCRGRRTVQAPPVRPQARHRTSTSRSRRSPASTRVARAGRPELAVQIELRRIWAPSIQRRRPLRRTTRRRWRATAGVATCFPAARAMLGCQPIRRIRLGCCAGRSPSSTTTGSTTGRGLWRRGGRMQRCTGCACAPPPAGRRVRKPAPSRPVIVFAAGALSEPLLCARRRSGGRARAAAGAHRRHCAGHGLARHL